MWGPDVADFADRKIDDPVPTGLVGPAIRGAAIAALGVPIIASLFRVDSPVSAQQQGLAVSATPGGVGIAGVGRPGWIAHFPDRCIDDAVATPLRGSAVRRTAIAALGVPVIADFAGRYVDDPVATPLEGFAISGAAVTVAVAGIAEIANLFEVEDPVTATLNTAFMG